MDVIKTTKRELGHRLIRGERAAESFVGAEGCPVKYCSHAQPVRGVLKRSRNGCLQVDLRSSAQLIAFIGGVGGKGMRVWIQGQGGGRG